MRGLSLAQLEAAVAKELYGPLQPGQEAGLRATPVQFSMQRNNASCAVFVPLAGTAGVILPRYPQDALVSESLRHRGSECAALAGAAALAAGQSGQDAGKLNTSAHAAFQLNIQFQLNNSHCCQHFSSVFVLHQLRRLTITSRPSTQISVGDTSVDGAVDEFRCVCEYDAGPSLSSSPLSSFNARHVVLETTQPCRYTSNIFVRLYIEYAQVRPANTGSRVVVTA
jgi:hypothetical protein